MTYLTRRGATCLNSDRPRFVRLRVEMPPVVPVVAGVSEDVRARARQAQRFVTVRFRHGVHRTGLVPILPLKVVRLAAVVR